MKSSTIEEGSLPTHTTDIPDSLLQALSVCRTLPSIPAVALRVLDLCQSDDIGTSEVSKVISRDPALTAKVLKVANSPLCGVRAQVTTLDHAVSLLGINATLSLALTFSLVRELRKSAVVKFDHQAYWRRSATAAVATRIVGSCVKAASRDELFLAGLIQDIGMLVLNEAMYKIYGRLVTSANADHSALAEIERRELGADHSQVGSWFLAKWALPENLVAAVAGSHIPEEIVNSELLVKSVAVGSLIAEIWVNPNTGAATASAREAANTILRIPEDQFEKLLGEVAAELPEATANLDINIGGTAFVNRLLDQAREILVELSLQVQRQAREVEIQAQRDELTSLYNRTYLNEHLKQQFSLSQQMGQPLTVIFLDIDNFKSVNDNYGHNGGDVVLISVAHVLQSAARSNDTVVRFGGDEFVTVLVNSDDRIGAMVAERMRAAIEAKPHNTGNDNWIRVTASAGCATTSPSAPSSSINELLESADRCLYAAKSSGRNRVVTTAIPGLERKESSLHLTPRKPADDI